MPFPLEEKYIQALEAELNVSFPPLFKSKMMKDNGGELGKGDFWFQLYPFWDKSDRKRLSRTCNHIGLETKNAREWTDFPAFGIAIGADDYGNQIILMHTGDGVLQESIFFWDHEKNEADSIEKIANDITEFE